MNTRLKELRKELNLTQQEFADKLGIKRGAIANYEIGRNVPIDAVISLISKTFNVNETWLRTGEGEMFVQMSDEDKLFAWVGRVLADRPESFRRRFFNMLMALSDDEWVLLENKILQLSSPNPEINKKKDQD